MLTFRACSLAIVLCLIFSGLQTFAQDEKKSHDAYLKGMQHFRNARYKDAVKLFDEAIRQDSANYNAWIKKGFCMGMTGDFEGELSAYTEVIRHDPQHKWAYISRGSAYNRTGNYDAALNDFNKALEIDPDDAEIYNNRGFAYKGKGEKENACSDWQRSKQLGNKEALVILENNQCK